MKTKLFLFLTALLIFAALLFFHFQRNVTRVLISISEATMRASTTIAVNDAVFYTLSDKMQYEDLVNTISFRSELDVSLGNGIKSYLVVRTPCFHCQGHGFNLWSGKYDSASASKKKEKKKGKLPMEAVQTLAEVQKVTSSSYCQ